MSRIDDLLMFDPLETAEKLTGVRIDDGRGFDNPAIGLGFLLAQSHGRNKEAVLRGLNDTYHNMELPAYQQVVEKFGFKCVLTDRWRSSHDYDESFFIYAHADGLLLAFDTFAGKRVNGGNVYCNWRSLTDDAYSCIGSGGWIEGPENGYVGAVFDSHHDCREALIHNLNKMRNRGEFVRPWIKRPFLWLLHYDEPKKNGYDYNAINAERISRLPQWVQDFVGPT